MRKAWWLVIVTCALGCGSSSSKVDAGKTGDAKKLDSASSGTALTVKNFDAWCSVSVNGGTASSAAEQTVDVTPGSIPLTATALSGFELGDWHHTTGDTGAGDPGTVSNGTSSTTVTVGSAATCVWVCCPFTNGTGCPTTDQCP